MVVFQKDTIRKVVFVVMSAPYSTPYFFKIRMFGVVFLVSRSVMTFPQEAMLPVCVYVAMPLIL